jgi:uncharacterized membrane protein
MWWGYGYHAFVPFWFWLARPLFFIIVVIAIVSLIRLLVWRRWGWRRGPCGHGGWTAPGQDAEAVLRRRLAAGEIDEAEYRRVREILKG